MNIPATELKQALKKLSVVKTEVYQIGPHGLSAQDPDILVAVESPLTGLGGSFNVSKKFGQVVSRMSGAIDVSVQGKALVLKSAKAKVDLEIQEIKPVVLPALPDKWLGFPLDVFKKDLSIAAASASPNKSAPYGGVVQIQSLPLGLEEDFPQGYRFVGTDSIVLTVVKQTSELGFEFNWLLNMPAAQTIQLLDGNLSVGETNTALVLKSGGTTVYASKPVQKYPDFDRHLAMPTKITFQLNPQDWLEALHTVEPLMDETVDQGAVSVHFENSVVQFKNIGVGSTAQDEAPYEQLDPDPVFDPQVLDMKIQAKYLSGFLSKAGETATFGITDFPVRMESNGVVVLTMPLGGKK